MSNINLLKLFRALTFLFTLIFITTKVAFAQDGEALFKSNCTSCHAINDKVIGPALKGVGNRHTEEWLLKWVHNSQTLVKAGDADAVKLFNDNNKVVMTPFNLKDPEIKAIFAYIKTEGDKPPVVATKTTPNGTPEEKGSNLWIYLFAAAIILILVTSVLRRVQHTLARAVRVKQGLPEPVPTTRTKASIYWIRNNKKLVAVILIFLFLYGGAKAWYGMMSIGISQGYTPDQPIAYSHKLHAGDMKISCIYCHVGAEKGKTAGIPPAMVCMNCHKFVKKGPTGETAEIAKIYKALDYNPETGVYGTNPKPIVWNRVHNLPDLAYFNHAQHFVVGKIQCQTCHGQVQDSMTVITQYSPLTMGWCIDCHRRTPVQMASNHYYDDYHKKLLNKYGSDSLITVERIGGTECARCHY